MVTLYDFGTGSILWCQTQGVYMLLELHDDEEGNSLVARIRNIFLDYQAEIWVRESFNDLRAVNVIKWVLTDDEGVRCVWERPVGSRDLPVITQRSPRFTGEWERGPNEVSIA